MQGVHQPEDGRPAGDGAGLLPVTPQRRRAQGESGEEVDQVTVDDVDQDVDEAVADDVVPVEKIIQGEAHVGHGALGQGAVERCRVDALGAQVRQPDMAVFGDVRLIVENKRAGEGPHVDENHHHGRR